MNRKASQRLSFVALCVLGLGCTRPKAAEKEEHPAAVDSAHADEAAHGELPRRVRVSKEVIANAKIKTSLVARRALQSFIDLPGEVSPDPDRTAKVSSPVSGRLERLAFTEGAVVKARDLLAVVRVPDLAERQSSFSSLTAQVAGARAKVERLEGLAKEGLASRQDLDAAHSEAGALEAQQRSAAERLRVLGIGPGAKPGSLLEIRAPRSGTVVSRDAVIGQPIDEGKVIATITDLREVWFLGRVFEHELARVTLGAHADVELNAYPGQPFEGRIAYLGMQVDPVARTVTARIALTNHDDRLRLGLFGTAHVGVGSEDAGPPKLVVPRSALTEIAGKTSVFVHHPDDDFEVHDVVVGSTALDDVEILTGLREGEEVVTDGAFTLKSLILKSTFGEGD